MGYNLAGLWVRVILNIKLYNYIVGIKLAFLYVYVTVYATYYFPLITNSNSYNVLYNFCSQKKPLP